MRIYAIYKDGDEVFRGSAEEVAKRFYICKERVYACEHKGILIDKIYEVKLVDITDPKMYTADTMVRLTSFEENVLEVVRRLKIYGNTTLPRIRNNELEKWLEALREHGCDSDVKAYNARSGSEITLEGSKLKKGKYDTNYIVSLRES